ncbi:molybdopterin-guanine dinucleotide biosynthesis protein B [Sediminibacillus massiliensis]|uniref:molybdopterin-guanine dinucleotide biosynthesis protein B n=1 Tax=Sediminibacillus massiliensis TaxID=1926277 RepID=UPI0009887CFF|nr:molybdopterin-guanine dinucleotide biosynthesis protein B [Sediminibacillus massiliensis]
MDENSRLPKLQIVGYKNSGKTTVTTELVSRLTQQGWNVATWKHHGHGGRPDMVTGTDSYLHQQAGSLAAGVEGGGEFHLSVKGLTQEGILSFYEKLPIDLLIIEGYKQLAFPKIALLRTDQDKLLLDELENVKAVICRDNSIEIATDIPVFLLDEKEKYLQWMESYLGRGRKHGKR